MLESNSVHRTPPVRTSHRSPTCNLSSFLPFLPLLFFSSRVGFESPLLSTPLSPAFWSPSELDPHNAYAFTSLYDLRNEPEMSQPRFVVPFYSGCALAHSVMSPLIVSQWISRSSFPFARLNLELLLRKSIVMMLFLLWFHRNILFLWCSFKRRSCILRITVGLSPLFYLVYMGSVSNNETWTAAGKLYWCINVIKILVNVSMKLSDLV